MASDKHEYSIYQEAITPPRTFRQLKRDLIGKDSYRGITLTYAWIANQWGHFSLGFIPTIMLKCLGETYEMFDPDEENPVLLCAHFISVIWFFFELYNFLGPLLVKRTSLSKVFYLGIGRKYIFDPKWINIAYDTFTDLCFFWLGAYVATITLSPTQIEYVIVFALILILIFPTIHWYHTKMYQHYAQYPFQFRLSQWNYTICKEDKEKVHRFMSTIQTGHHLLVFGNEKSCTTSLGVGILNELSILHKKCLYLTAIKLFDLFSGSYSKKSKKPYLLWTWKDTDFLVIDDINTSNSIHRELIDAQRFLEYIDSNPHQRAENREILCAKNIIWILGHPANNKKFHEEWCEMLIKIGVDPTKIESIDLPSPE